MRVVSGQLERKHILTIALEDYFQAPAFRKLIDRKRWGLFSSRLEQNCCRVLDRLDETGCRATFFVNARVAQTRGDVVQEVVRRCKTRNYLRIRGDSRKLNANGRTLFANGS